MAGKDWQDWQVSDEDDWYYKARVGSRDQVIGPFTREQMAEMAQAGQMGETTPVRCGEGPWWEARHVFPRRRRGRRGLWIALLFACLAGVLGAFADRLFDGYLARHQAGEARPGAVSVSDRVAPDKNAHPVHEKLSSEALVSLTNEARRGNGVPVLKENSQLGRIAEERARDMLKKQYFGHVAPDGESYPDVARKVGYRYKCLSENIASGDFPTNRKLIEGWMQSPGHRKNLLSTDVDEIGIAVVRGSLKGEETWVAVQIFGLPAPEGEQGAVPATSCTVPSPGAAQAIESGKREIEDMERQLASMKTEMELEKLILERKGAPSKEESDAFNARAGQFNGLVEKSNDKRATVQGMINDYNASVQRYNACLEAERTAKPS
jgi:uncharacterized protein YkwD